MKLLCDENLSFQSTSRIADLYPGSAHVKDFGLMTDDDTTIWTFAKENTFTIVSKDADFHQLSLLRGHPPRFIFLKIGNSTTSTIVGLLRDSYDIIRVFHASASESLLIPPISLVS